MQLACMVNMTSGLANAPPLSVIRLAAFGGEAEERAILGRG